MRKLVRTIQLLRRILHSPVSQRTITTFSIVGLSGLLSQFAGGQVNRASLSPEIMAIHARAKRPVAKASADLDLAASNAASSSTFNSEQGPGPGPIGPGPGCDLFPAPASVGASVPLSYFGPPPSDVEKSLVGPVQLLNSGTLNVKHGTITLPLYRRSLAGTNQSVWYILTDVSDSNVAAALGLNFSTKLLFMGN